MGGETAATGAVSLKVSYNVKLYISAKPRQRRHYMYDVEKLNPSTGKFEEAVKTNEDLLTIQNDMRLIIEDNTASGDPVTGGSGLSRSTFYANNGLMKVMDVSLPLRIEVRKFVGPSKDPVPIKKGEIEAVFEIIDPPEDTGNIKGPRPNAASSITGKNFIEDFIKELNSGAANKNYNCIRDFVDPPFHSRCRKSGLKVTASDVLYNRSRQPLPAVPSNKTLVKVRIRPRKQKKGTAIVFFHPPPILGDSYQLKITINNKKGEAMALRSDDGSECAHFETPKITVWKRIKIYMIIRQEGVDDGGGGIKWDETINAYRDAFIEVKEPSPKHILDISENEWMNYLDRFVYGSGNIFSRNWKRKLWKIYKSVKDPKYYDSASAEKWIHLWSYCFPQEYDYAYRIQRGDTLSKIARRHGMTWEELYNYEDISTKKSNEDRLDDQKNASGRPAESIGNPDLIYPGDIVMVPLNLTPPDDHKVEPTSWDLVDLLARKIFQAKLKKFWSSFRKPFKGRRIGLCIFFCKPPSEESDVLGMHSGGKLFFMVRSGDVTVTFTHEMGHALFLEHGVTNSVRATDNPGAHPLKADASYSQRSEDEGSTGPYFDQHYSEDMVPCSMSYENDYYDSNGNMLADDDHPLHYDRNNHPVDWHFCGVCLLQLRFYDSKRMLLANNDSFRKLQYLQTPSLKIAEKVGTVPIPPKNEQEFEEIQFNNPLTVQSGHEKEILILYPQEAVMNNDGALIYKDLSYLTQANTVDGHPRAKWKSSDSTKAEVIVEKRDDIWWSILKGKNSSLPSPTITFEVRYGPNPGDVYTSNPVTVTVTP